MLLRYLTWRIDLDVRFMLRVVAFDRRGVGAALVDRDLLGRAMTADRFAQKAQRRPAVAFGRQQKINRVADLVDGKTGAPGTGA